MNKIFICKVITLLIVSLISLSSALFCQIPDAINFQAIARDINGNPLINENIQIRLSIIDSSQNGIIVYQEVRAIETNLYGSFSFQIGLNPSIITIGTFQSINWNTGNKHLKIDYDPSNSNNFNLSLGIIQFVTVPFSFSTKDVEYIDITNVQDGDQLIYNSNIQKFVPEQIQNTPIEWSEILNKPVFANVATSGSYEDLIDTPSIPTNISAFTNDVGYLTQNEYQTLYYSNDTLYLTNGGFVYLPLNQINLLPPAIISQSSTNIQSFSVELNGSVNPNKFSTSIVFEWGLTPLYGNSITASQSPITGNTTTNISANLSNLQSNRTYHYRIKASNAIDVSYGNDMSFTTAPSAPQLTTTEPLNISFNSATLGGNVTYLGGAPILANGICFSTSPNPTILNNTVSGTISDNNFVVNLTGLIPNTIYYAKAFATNSIGTGYGNQIVFTTLSPYNTFTDTRDNTVYHSIVIGTQEWMIENLKYLPSVMDTSTYSATSSCYYVYDYYGTSVVEAKATTNYNLYGVLYNWHAASNGATSGSNTQVGIQGICPSGWHLPSNYEFQVLEDYINSEYNLRQVGNAWDCYNSSTNEYGFSGLPGGYFIPISQPSTHSFTDIGDKASWYSSNININPNGYILSTKSHWSLNCYDFWGTSGPNLERAFSVRCVKNE
ncbi:MAG: FISUMP domain-containing protein [Bacteroidales bacterium]|jgi:uncharacterized protein (TIGR02145 family)|nr:FISUMP domain-containing protein [Bacteroidales bacterium]